MEKQTLIFLFVLNALVAHCQLFKADIENDGSTLIVNLQVFGTGDITTGFSQIEFFIRTPLSTPTFDVDVANIEVNTTNFPGNIPISLTADYTSGGFRILQFGYSPANSNGTNTYTNSTEYELVRIPLINAPAGSMGDFEIVHDGLNYSTFLNLTSDSGSELSYTTCVNNNTCPGEHIFYGDTGLNGQVYSSEVMGVALPVELINFSASPVEKYIHLNWTSASEINFSGYELQRSTDGRLFNKIAWVDGKGGHQEAYYFFEDQSVTAGTRYFYRLKMVDEDGSFSYSVVRSVMLPGKVEKPVIAPNPTQGITKVYFNVPNDVKAKLTIIDAMGKVFIEQEVHLLTGENVVEVDMFLLPSGIYSLQLNESGRSLWRERMIKI